MTTKGNREEDYIRARIYDQLVETLTDRMRRLGDLYRHHLSAAYNSLDYGFCFGRFAINSINGQIVYEVFPPEQLYLDWQAPNANAMTCVVGVSKKDSVGDLRVT